MTEDITASGTPQTGAEPGQQAGGIPSAGAVADSTTASPKPTTETTDDRRFTQADLDRLVDARLTEEPRKRTKQAEAEKLAAAGEYQKLADEYKAQADGAAVELEALRAQLAEMTTAVEATYRARIDALPKDAQKAVKSLPDGLSLAQRLAWLDANATLFTRPAPPNINATAQGTGDAGLTDDEAVELAAIYGVQAKYLKR